MALYLGSIGEMEEAGVSGCAYEHGPNQVVLAKAGP